MKCLSKAVYAGEDRETTLDWLIRNPRQEQAGCAYLFDEDLRGAEIRETHGLIAIDTAEGIAVIPGIPPGGTVSVSVRVGRETVGKACRAGLVYARSCERIECETGEDISSE